jgi:hypothetical protein
MTPMNNRLHFVQNIASGQQITTKEWGHAFSDVVFLFLGAPDYKGVLHSSSLPDYIEDKKSGGQQTDCLAKNLCTDSTIIIGREARNRQMLKTVNKSTLIGTL